jgi:hypothetical protein
MSKLDALAGALASGRAKVGEAKPKRKRARTMSDGAKMVRDAIARSRSHDEIVTIDDYPGVRSALKRAASDSVNAGPVFEFWGGRGRSEWRVHVRNAD